MTVEEEIEEFILDEDYLTDATDDDYNGGYSPMKLRPNNTVYNSLPRPPVPSKSTVGNDEHLHEILGIMGFYCSPECSASLVPDTCQSPRCTSENFAKESRRELEEPPDVYTMPQVRIHSMLSVVITLLVICMSIYAQLLYVGAWNTDIGIVPGDFHYNVTDFVDRDLVLRFATTRYMLDFPEAPSVDIFVLGGDIASFSKEIQTLCMSTGKFTTVHYTGIVSASANMNLLNSGKYFKEVSKLLNWHDGGYVTTNIDESVLGDTVSLIRQGLCRNVYESVSNFTELIDNVCLTSEIIISDVFFDKYFCGDTPLSIVDLKRVTGIIISYMKGQLYDISSVLSRQEELYDIILVVDPLQQFLHEFPTTTLLLEFHNLMKQVPASEMNIKFPRLVFTKNIPSGPMEYQKIHSKACSVGMLPMGRISLSLNKTTALAWKSMCQNKLYLNYYYILKRFRQTCQYLEQLTTGDITSSLITLQSGDILTIDGACHSYNTLTSIQSSQSISQH
jgi:hypothetical protein